MKKFAAALAMCAALLCSQAQAKTFVGVLWPMFGPLPAIGLVELVAELKRMPDVQVETYVHQAWPSLVEDLKHLPPGTHTVVVGYSLGANSSVFVANNSKYIDTIIALQPSLLSWNPPVTGKVGRYIEIYNPNPWETFGGMGSRKLVGPNIEYIANNDSHPGAQFDPQFRDLVKSEVAKYVAQDRGQNPDQDQDHDQDGVVTAQAQPQLQPQPPKPVQQPVDLAMQGQIIDLHQPRAVKDRAAPQPAPVEVAAAALPPPPAADQDATPQSLVARAADPPPAQPARFEQAMDERPASEPRRWTAFLDKMTGAARSGDLFVEHKVAATRKLTRADLMAYAKRFYSRSHPAAPGNLAPAGTITTASVAFDRSALGGE